ncbi:MAG TPA: ORF6N domain-containing protein [Chitinophagaceae bacterium]|nr:ORF6N domain-containing protein [Chitinophagaceae bacterium]
MQLMVIQRKIYEIRGYKVMLDFDLAELYAVETRTLNQAIKRNRRSFPNDFMFRLSLKEWKSMSSQFVMTSAVRRRPKKALPYVFTEHGVTMLASVLKSLKARKMNIAIVRAFIALKQFVLVHSDLLKQLKELKARVGNHDVRLNQIYKAIERLLAEKVQQKEWKDRDRIGF